MNLPTWNSERFWKDVPAARVVVSQRATTSSRHPGRVFEGSVRREGRSLARCSKCSGFFLLLSGETDAAQLSHAPHYVTRTGKLVLVDCVGTEISP